MSHILCTLSTILTVSDSPNASANGARCLRVSQEEISQQIDLYYPGNRHRINCVDNRAEIFHAIDRCTFQRLNMHTSRPKPSENATRQLMALLIAGLALGGPLAGMMLVSLGGHSYMHLLPEYAPLPLSLAILSVGGTAVGLALLPSFFFGAVCGYVLPNFWPYLAASSGLAWATALGLGLGRLFSTSFLEVLLQRKADWWSVYQRLVHASGAFLPTSIALLRLAPHMPFALTNLACARLPLSPKTIWSASFVGLLPRTLFAVHIGSQLQDWRSLLNRQGPPWELLLSLGLLIVLAYASRRVARRIDA